MAIRLVRESSDTPNITNKDDVRMIRYAYGGYNGVVKKYGQELASTYNLNKFTIGSGRIVLQGWEVDIDEEGFEITLQPLTGGVQYHTVYLEVNAFTETVDIKSVYNSYASYPQISEGDDLTEVPNGIARLPLFTFSSYNGTITDSNRLVETILSVKERLDRLGFRVGEISFPPTITNGTYELTRQGNYVLGRIKIARCDYTGVEGIVLPENFRPKIETKCFGTAKEMQGSNGDIAATWTGVTFIIRSDGTIGDSTIVFPSENPFGVSRVFTYIDLEFAFGFEAEPIV